MAVEQIPREGWHPFLEELTRVVQGSQARIEVASCDFGDQRLVEGVPLLGLSYDERENYLEVDLENVGHRIPGPTDLFVEIQPHGVIAIEVIGADGARTLMRLREPLMLPEPAGS